LVDMYVFCVCATLPSFFLVYFYFVKPFKSTGAWNLSIKKIVSTDEHFDRLISSTGKFQ